MDKIQQLIDLANIVDPELRNFTQSTLDALSISIWQSRASKNHHLPDERGEWGNWLHTMRVTTNCQYLCEAFNITGMRRDELLCAAILHDCRRYGENDDMDYTVNNHPALVRKFARQFYPDITDKMDDVFTIIEYHMGKWSVPPIKWEFTVLSFTPGLPGEEIGVSVELLGMLLHIADFTDARLVPATLGIKLT